MSLVFLPGELYLIRIFECSLCSFSYSHLSILSFKPLTSLNWCLPILFVLYCTFLFVFSYFWISPYLVVFLWFSSCLCCCSHSGFACFRVHFHSGHVFSVLFSFSFYHLFFLFVSFVDMVFDSDRFSFLHFCISFTLYDQFYLYYLSG